MKHFLYRIYDEENEDGIEILVYADSKNEADFQLSNDDTILHFSYLDELSEEEAENSGLDEI